MKCHRAVFGIKKHLHSVVFWNKWLKLGQSYHQWWRRSRFIVSHRPTDWTKRCRQCRTCIITVDL